jgi:V/A-type H+-transporting ATPase subunit A
MLKIIFLFDEAARAQLNEGRTIKKILDDPIREQIARIKYLPETELAKLDEIIAQLKLKVSGEVEG